MIIQHAMLHILDTNTGSLIVSQGEMPLDNAGYKRILKNWSPKCQLGM